MKSKELIEKAIRLSGEPQTVELLEQFLRANAVIKDIKFDLAKFVDKNSTHEFAKGIYHRDGYKYVTNGRVLVSVKSGYDAAYEDKIISPAGEIIETRFPDWKHAMDQFHMFSELRLQQSVQEICGIVQENEAVAKANGKKLILTILHDDRQTDFRSREFSLFLMFLKACPEAVTYIRDNQCLYACDGENFCLIMCTNIDSSYIEDYSIIHLQ
jgi:hypothetical protein